MKSVTLLTFFRFGRKFSVCVLPSVPNDLFVLEMYEHNGSFFGEKYIDKDMAVWMCDKYTVLA